jgi:hypothetical protein
LYLRTASTDKHVVEKTVHARTLDGHFKHLRRTVGEDRGGDVCFLEGLEGAKIFREGGQAGVLVHQLIAAHRVQFKPQSRGGKAQPIPGDLPKGLVAAGQTADEAVFDLLAAPQVCQGGTFAGVELLGQQADRVHVEERAEGIERDSLDAGRVSHAR